MLTFGEIIKGARKAKRLRQQQVGDAAGVSNVTVSNWERNANLADVKRLKALADVLDLDVVHLRRALEAARDAAATPSEVSGDVQPLVDELPSIPEPSSVPQTLPVYGTSPGAAIGGFYMSHKPVLQVGRPLPLTGRTDVFGCQVQTTDMADRFEPGDLVIAELHRRPRANDYVLIELKPDGRSDQRPMLLKRFLGDEPDAMRVEQLKPARKFSIPRDKIVNVFRVLRTEDLV